MQTDPAPSTQPDLGSMLGDVRAAIAAEGPRKGLAGAVQEAFLKIIEVLVALLLDFRAGRLAAGALAPAGPDAGAARAEEAEDAPCAAPGERGRATLESGCRGWWPAPWFRRRDWIPAFAGMTGKVEQYAGPSDGSAQSDRGSLSRNDEKIGIGGRAAMPPRERSSARLDREVDRRANGAHDGFLPEVRGANESHELLGGAEKANHIGGLRAMVGKPRVREAYPPYGWDEGAVRWSFSKKRDLAGAEWRGVIVPV